MSQVEDTKLRVNNGGNGGASTCHESRGPAGFGRLRATLLLAAFVSLLAGAPKLLAYPVSYSLSGTFGTATGPDPLGLAGKTFSISGVIDSLAPCCPYQTTVSLTVNGVAASPIARVSLSAGSISVSATVLGIPFGASVPVPTVSALPYPFGSASLGAGGTVTYGTTPTVLIIASGTASATGTPPSLTAGATSLTFNYQTGGNTPASQTDAITATGANFSVSATTNSGGNWLSVGPASGASAATLAVAVNPGGLSAGTYTGTISVTSVQAANNLNISVTLNVSQSAAFTVSPPSLAFSYHTGGSAPTSQSLTIGTSPASPVSFTASASGGGWLSVSPGGGTSPGSVSVSVNPVGLNPGTYQGAVAISGTATNSPLSVPVTLTVTTSLSSSPNSLLFTYQTGGSAPPAQSLSISASGSGAAAISVTTGGAWLSVLPSNSTTPASLSVSVNPTGLAPGTYNGSITVSSAGASNTLSVPVTLTVSSQPLLSVAPATLLFSYQLGASTPQPQTLSITGTGSSPFNYSVSTTGGAWLKVSSSSGATPGSVSVSVNTSGLAPNTYNGTITIAAAGAANSPATIPVLLNVTSLGTTITAAPPQIQFAYQVGGASLSAQTIAVTSSPAGVALTVAASGASWLSVQPLSAAAPATLSVSANPSGLSSGTYNGTISITGAGASNSPLTVTVTLTVTAKTTITAAPASLAFSVPAGSASSSPMAVAIGSSTGAQNFIVTAGAAWLSATPASGVTPANLAVSVNPSGLNPGSYTSFLTLLPAAGLSGPLSLSVTLTVNPGAPSITAITDAASELLVPLAPSPGQPGTISVSGTGPAGIAPGSIISIWGSSIGPNDPVALQLTSAGKVSTTLDNTSVIINGAAAPLLVVSTNQINAMVPYSVAGLSSTTLTVNRNGLPSNPIQVPITKTAPALFTTELTGKGQGAILNQDGTINSATNPAEKGSVIVVYAEGAGVTNPPSVDGGITGTLVAQLPRPVLPVTVKIGGQSAEVRYAGAAPGLIAGALQVNVRIPQNAPSGNTALILNVGGVSSQPGVTVSVK